MEVRHMNYSAYESSNFHLNQTNISNSIQRDEKKKPKYVSQIDEEIHELIDFHSCSCLCYSPAPTTHNRLLYTEKKKNEKKQ